LVKGKHAKKSTHLVWLATSSFMEYLFDVEKHSFKWEDVKCDGNI